MYTTVFANPNIAPDLRKLLEDMAEAMDDPMFYGDDERPTRPQRREYRERNLKAWERLK